uniref:Uncharacterized protein n=1 Tax=Anguilla anguilla TaxID=7936 RepID=A0A0E9XLS7_ANGAN
MTFTINCQEQVYISNLTWCGLVGFNHVFKIVDTQCTYLL